MQEILCSALKYSYQLQTGRNVENELKVNLSILLILNKRTCRGETIVIIIFLIFSVQLPDHFFQGSDGKVIL